MTPSQNVEANESVLLKCEVDSFDGIGGMNFMLDPQGTALCGLEYKSGQCKNTGDICLTKYSASCYNGTVFTIRVSIPFIWNGQKLWCRAALAKSSIITFTVTGLFKFITII